MCCTPHGDINYFCGLDFLSKPDTKVEQAAHDQMVKKLATEKLDASNDLVKMLNSLGARAAAFTIRDKQVIKRYLLTVLSSSPGQSTLL